MTSTMYLKKTLRRGNCYHMPLPAMNYILILLLLLSPMRYADAEVLSGPTTGDFKNSVTGGDYSYSVVAGGRNNTAKQRGSAVLGGLHNVAGGDEFDWVEACAFVGGGFKNTANSYYSVVAGGSLNTAEGAGSAVSGGFSNKATGLVSTVLGGYWNEASGAGSIAMGAEAYAKNQQSFVVNMLSDCLNSGGYIESGECDTGKFEDFAFPASENGIESTRDKEIVFGSEAFTIRIGREPEHIATIDSTNIKRFIELLNSPSPTETPTDAPTLGSSQNPSALPSSSPSTNDPSETPSLTPSTTSTILPECKDGSDTFQKNESGKPKGCAWVRVKNTKERCDREVFHNGKKKPARELCCESCDTGDNSNTINEELAKLQASNAELQASNAELQASLQETNAVVKELQEAIKELQESCA